MVAYKFYCVDDGGHIVKRHDVEAADDVAALERARELCGEFEIELWEGARFITHVAKDGNASKLPNPERAQERKEIARRF